MNAFWFWFALIYTPSNMPCQSVVSEQRYGSKITNRRELWIYSCLLQTESAGDQESLFAIEVKLEKNELGLGE